MRIYALVVALLSIMMISESAQAGTNASGQGNVRDRGTCKNLVASYSQYTINGGLAGKYTRAAIRRCRAGQPI